MVLLFGLRLIIEPEVDSPTVKFDVALARTLVKAKRGGVTRGKLAQGTVSNVVKRVVLHVSAIELRPHRRVAGIPKYGIQRML